MEEELNIDMDAAQAAMDADFASEGGDSGGDVGYEVETSVPAPAPAPLSAPAAPPVAPEPWRQPPKSWKADLHPLYQKLDPAVMQNIHEREKQALYGIMQYKSAYDPYASLEKQYKPYLEQAKLAMPDVVGRLMQAHLALSSPDTAAKQQFFQRMVQEYGLGEFLGQPGQPQGTPQVDQVIQRYVAPLQETIQRLQAREDQKLLEQSQSEVDKFFADPQNEFAQELESDMIQLIEKGLATSLADAYEKAVWHNPSVRAKALQKEIEKTTKPVKSAPRNVRSGSTPPASTKPPGDEDMDATMRSIFRDINNR